MPLRINIVLVNGLKDSGSTATRRIVMYWIKGNPLHLYTLYNREIFVWWFESVCKAPCSDLNARESGNSFSFLPLDHTLFNKRTNVVPIVAEGEDVTYAALIEQAGAIVHWVSLAACTTIIAGVDLWCLWDCPNELRIFYFKVPMLSAFVACIPFRLLFNGGTRPSRVGHFQLIGFLLWSSTRFVL